jgi:uncharacterized LabA/DUF88 family protein
MSKNVAVFVDVANLYYSARGQDTDVDYVALLKAATKGRDLIRAYAYSGLDPENENQRKFIDFLNKNGYKVVHKDIRKFGDGRVKANLDIELVVDLFRLADRMDIAVIISGDGDFAPAIRALQDKGVRCEVISFRPNTSSDLIAVADEFIDIMKIIGIGRGAKDDKDKDAEAKAPRGAKAMSAPEMPAKEVVPEFGFRDASPHVAAAALAALREGKDSSTGRGRGRGRGRTAAAAAPATPAAASAAAAEEPDVSEAAAATASTGNGDAQEGDGRRRRRRRGGRGRGRGGRGTAAQAETTGTAPGEEIGWTELDDLSQLDDLGEEREYTFEEADAATLAELGLLDSGAAAEAAPAAATDGQEQAAEEEKPKRRRTSRSTSKAAAKPAEEPAAASAEEKPKRRRTTRKAADEAASGEAGEEPAQPPTRSEATCVQPHPQGQCGGAKRVQASPPPEEPRQAGRCAARRDAGVRGRRRVAGHLEAVPRRARLAQPAIRDPACRRPARVGPAFVRFAARDGLSSRRHPRRPRGRPRTAPLRSRARAALRVRPGHSPHCAGRAAPTRWLHRLRRAPGRRHPSPSRPARHASRDLAWAS